MYSHNMVGANDLEACKTFYDATFAAVGGPEGIWNDDKTRITYLHNNGVFIVIKPINGEPATVANGNTIGFVMDSGEQCDAWHKAGAAAGGTPIEDAPGPRNFEGRMLYLAYLRDPTGHKICALHPMG